MKTHILPASSQDSIGIILQTLQAGGLVAFPTDTVYGIGALAFNEDAVKSIYFAKGRTTEKAIPILLGEAEEIDKVASVVPTLARRLAERFWPGPLTLVIPKKATLPESVSSTDTVGVRIPDNPTTHALLRLAGPMAVTSANISGGLSPSTAQEVFDQLGGRIELILDGGKTSGGIPSTVVDCTKSEPVILRKGPISLKEILSALT
jgi:L-threonylcarbamoyladenylate synthase